MSIATAHDKLKVADQALVAAKVIRDEAFEALIAAVVAENWRIILRQRDPYGERVVFEHLHGGRAMALEDVVAEVLGAPA
jgi:hypothetical protein